MIFDFQKNEAKKFPYQVVIIMKDSSFTIHLMVNYYRVSDYRGYQIRSAIGIHILKARLKNNVTQQQLANLLKTKQSSISRIENAKTYPSLRYLAKVAKALNIEFDLVIKTSASAAVKKCVRTRTRT